MSLKKVPGPKLVSKIVGSADLTPPRWRAKRGVKITSQENPPDIEPEKINDTRIESRVIQERTNERKKTDTELTGDLGDKFVTKQLLKNGQIATKTETYPLEGSNLVVTPETLDASQNATGDGHIEQTVLVATLPGPTVFDSKVDEDGKLVSLAKTRKLISSITEGETLGGGIWTKTYREGETDDVASEVVETRPIPGNPVPATRLDEDGVKIDIVRTLKQASVITSAETVVTGVWTKTTKERVSDLVAWEVVETRTVPGSLINSSRLDEDGNVVSIARTLQTFASAITSETLSGGVWTKNTIEKVSNLVCWQVTEARTVPGNSVPYSKLDEDGVAVAGTRILKDTTLITTQETIVGSNWFRVVKEKVTEKISWEVTEARAFPGTAITTTRLDSDGVPITTVKTLKQASVIVTQELVVGSVWSKTTKQDYTGSTLLAWEVVESRAIPGNSVLSNKIDSDHEIDNITEQVRATSVITPSATESGGFVTSIDSEPIPTSDLIAKQKTSVKRFLDRAEFTVSIPDVIPSVFKATIPLRTEVHVVSGTASMPSLTTNEFQHTERQLTKLLKETRSTILDAVTLPVVITGHETSSEFGGAVLDIVSTLGTSPLTADSGLLIVDSSVKPLGNGLDFKQTKKLLTGPWPTITNKLFDEEMQVAITEERQVVDPSYTIATGTYFIETLRAIDTWKSQRVRITRTPTAVDVASAIVTYQYSPFQFPGYVVSALNGVYQRRAGAQLCKQIIRTWWVTGALPVIAVDEIFTDTCIINTLNDVTKAEYANNVLHDDLIVLGLFFPATTPSSTLYRLGVQSGTAHVDVPSLYSGGTGYQVGNILTVASGGGSLTVRVDSVQSPNGNIIGFHMTAHASNFPNGLTGPITATGGSGTTAQFYVYGDDSPTYTPGTAWIGQEKIVAAKVTKENIPGLWKVQTRSVVMR